MDNLERMQLSSVSRMLNQMLNAERDELSRPRQTRNRTHVLAAAKAVRANLAVREKCLPFLPSCNPGWKILMELYIAKSESIPISITDVGHACSLPTATALRWIGLLCDHELLYRVPDHADRRRVWLKLGDRGLAAVECVISDMTTRIVTNVDALAVA